MASADPMPWKRRKDISGQGEKAILSVQLALSDQSSQLEYLVWIDFGLKPQI